MPAFFRAKHRGKADRAKVGIKLVVGCFGIHAQPAHKTRGGHIAKHTHRHRQFRHRRVFFHERDLFNVQYAGDHLPEAILHIVLWHDFYFGSAQRRTGVTVRGGFIQHSSISGNP